MTSVKGEDDVKYYKKYYTVLYLKGLQAISLTDKAW